MAREELQRRVIQNKADRLLMMKQLDGDAVEPMLVAMQVSAGAKMREGVPKIIKLLRHPDLRVKLAAIATLSEIGDERGIQPILDAPELMIMEFGSCPLAKFGAPVLPTLTSLARRSNPLGVLPKQSKKDRRSRNAASCIGQIRDEKAIPGLMALLHDEDDSIRLAAMQALVGMKAREVEPELDKMLHDRDLTVRSLALRTVAQADKAKYLPKVREVVASSKDLERMRAIELIAEFDDRGSIPQLEELLRDGDEFVRHKAAVSLWKMTGKAYQYEKGNMIGILEMPWRRRLKDAREGRGHEHPSQTITEAHKEGFLLEEIAE